MKVFFKSFFLILTVLIFSVACTTKKTVQTRNKMVLNLRSEPPVMDWTRSADTTSSLIIDNIMDGLTDYDISDPEMRAIPKIAERWEVSKDGKTYTFFLRKDVTWHDGLPVTAQHFYDGWKRLLDPNTAAPYSYFLFDVKNAQAFYDGKVDFSKVGVKVVDPHTFQVTLSHPAAYFIFIPTHSSTFPVRLDLINKYKEKWVEAGNIVGNGPYKMTTWVHDSHIVLSRNDQYYGTNARIPTIECRMIPEESSAVSSFEANQIDLIFPQIPALLLPRLRKVYPEELSEASQLGSYYIGFNLRKKPFDNPKVRRAFSMAINRAEITKIKNGGEVPFSSWIPKGMMGYNPNQGVKYDPKKAKELLSEAGYSDPASVPKIILMYNTNEDHKLVMENIQAQIAKNLGIRVSIENQEWKVYEAKLRNLKRLKNHNDNPNSPSMFRMGWVGDYPDPDNFMNLFTSYSDNNHTGWKNKNYDTLVKKAVRVKDGDARKKLYAQAQSILTEGDIPIMPLYVYAQHTLLRKNIKGYQQNPLQKLYLDQLYFE